MSLRPFLAIMAALLMGCFASAPPASAQTATLFPNQVPNGISSLSERYHQRIDLTLAGSPQSQSVMFTITMPPEVSLIGTSATVTSGTTTAYALIRTASATKFDVSLTGVNADLGPDLPLAVLTVEFDVETDPSFASGTQDTVYAVDFSSTANQTDFDIDVTKKNNEGIRVISFVNPDSTIGDTTTAGGRFYKLSFPGALPDPVHTELSGLRTIAGGGDDATDVLYSFFLSSEPDRRWPATGASPVAIVSQRPDGDGPLAGTRQKPKTIPGTFIREDFVAQFGGVADADSLNGMISLANTDTTKKYYVYVLADPAPGRTSPTSLEYGELSGGFFLGRSGPLTVRHPPEFVVVGWDYDDDSPDSFDETGVVQVPSDIVGMASVDANRKDNRDITVDTGLWKNKGDALSTLNGGVAPDPAETVDLLWFVEDVDNDGTFSFNIFLSTRDDLTDADFTDDHPGIDGLADAIQLSGTESLGINSKKFTFTPDATFGDSTYYAYFAATDDVYRTLAQAKDDPFIATPSPAKLMVTHSPQLTVDAFSLNDYDGSGDGDLDVITGIDVSQLIADGDGQFTKMLGPATRSVTVTWASQGADGDIDIDDNATIEFYYSTRSDFRDSRGSVANTSGNSNGTDLLNAIAADDNDTHYIGSTTEDGDDRLDDQFSWDLWSYVSAGGTIPRTGVRYYMYALMKGGTASRLISLTRSGSLDASGTSMALNFLHPPYIRPTEPAKDVSVTVDEPVLVSWEAFDVDNQESGGLTAVPAGSNGKQAPDSRTGSPNVRILLTSADFGEVTTWASVTKASAPGANTHRLWVGNSGDGSLAEEIEMNEGVDSSFVIIGNRLRNNLFSTSGLGASSGGLELQTNSGAGQTYYVYLAIDDGRDGNVADAVVGGVSQQKNFGAYSPLVKAPGTITFTGTVPANPPTGNRFIIPAEIKTAVDEAVKVPIIPDLLLPGTTVGSVSIFLAVDTSHFEAVDQDTSVAGIQPFALGENSEILAGNVNQGVITQDGQHHLEFIYNDYVTGLTFFDGKELLAIANLRPRALASGTVLNTTIELGRSGSRETKMRDMSTNKIAASLPSDINVEVRRRASVIVEVPLEGRATTTSDTMTFYLRRPGSYAIVVDSLFEANDTLSAAPGVQKLPDDAGANEYVLTNLPSGRFVLTAYIPRHLAGQDTLVVQPGSDPARIKPTLDGAGVQRASLLAGDATGYTDSNDDLVPDNFIGSEDINFINTALFTVPTDPLYNTYADINRDGIVNATDFDYANVNQTDNIGSPGKIKPVFPTYKLLLQDGNNTEAIVTLGETPDREIRAGEVFDVTVNVTGAHAVRTYEVHLEYDQTKLAVAEAPSGGDLLSNYMTSLAGKIMPGELGLVNSIIGRTPVGASGEGTLATVRFRAISRSSETVVKLSDAMLIDVDHTSEKPKVSGEARIVLSKDPIVYHDAQGAEIRGLILADADAKVDFNDFVVLVQAFGTSSGETGYDLMADLNGDDKVNFADFLLFSQDFGKEAVDAPSALRATKPVVLEGVNQDAQVSLSVVGDARMGEELTLTATLSQSESVQGWGLSVKYDPEQYEFVEAVAPQDNLLTSQGGSTPVFLVHQDGEGQISVANAVSEGAAGSGEGVLAVLRFRPKGEFEQGMFEVYDGILFDTNQLSNRAYADAALEVRMVPTAFALAQNYPNPFNPETTITYDVAAGSPVRLEVYNVMGQLVHTLVNEQQAAGRYRVVWSGMDAHSRQVASGVYFYRLQTEGFSAVKKLMLLK